MSVGASFTMQGTSLSSGTVSGFFRCVAIPRASSFSLDKNSVEINEKITLSITASSSSFSHKAAFLFGEFSTVIHLSAGEISTGFIPPAEWAEVIPKSKEGTVTVTLTTLKGETIVGSTSKVIKLSVPETEEFLPEYNVQIVSKKNNLVPNLWNATLQNRSTLQVNVLNFAGKYGATLASCNITVCENTKTGTSAEFQLPRSGNILVLVTVKDSRGFVSEQTLAHQVDQYSPPIMQCQKIIRCLEDGTPSDNGTSVLINYTKKFSSVRNLNAATVKVKYKKTNETSYSEWITLKTSPYILSGDFASVSSFEFVFQITDQVTKTPFETIQVLETAKIPFNIKKGGDGAAFGCYSETENELTVAYNLNLKGAFKYESLNNLLTPYANATFVYKDVRRYEALRIIFIDVKMQFSLNLNADSTIDLFKINGLKLSHTYPMVCHIDFRTSSTRGETVNYVNVDGIMRILNAKGFKTGDTINISGVILY